MLPGRIPFSSTANMAADRAETFLQAKSKFRAKGGRCWFIISVLFMVLCSIQTVDGKVQCGTLYCWQGKCLNESLSLCECFPGWTSPGCEFCTGRVG